MGRPAVFLALAAMLAAGALLLGADPEPAPFAPSRIRTASGGRADPDGFYEAGDCGECHKEQYAAWNGSLHSRSHTDAIYLAFAHRARKEGGEALYKFCSGCHAPAAVATGEIPRGEPSFLTDEGVSCDVCHHVAGISAVHEGGGANASIVLSDGEVRYGPFKDPAPTNAHESAGTELYRRAEFCSACHTLIHPTNGLVIENTYSEWKQGPYAKAGIQCQDCHMRTVEQALEVARTMKPLKVPGRAVEDGTQRPDVHAHLFVGGNVNRRLTGGGARHAEEARKRLQTAVELRLEPPSTAPRPGGALELVVALTNVAAGHAIPTSITELRQVWIDLRVEDAAGREVFRSGAVDADGKVDPDAVMYHSVLADEKGEVTYLPWRAVRIVKEKLLPPKQTVRERYDVTLPEDARPPFKVQAVLRYRSAPQEVMDRLFGKGKYPIEIVDMARAEAVLR